MFAAQIAMSTRRQVSNFRAHVSEISRATNHSDLNGTVANTHALNSMLRASPAAVLR
jgi:hypothetical protein